MEISVKLELMSMCVFSVRVSLEGRVDLDVALNPAELVLEGGVHCNLLAVHLALSGHGDVIPRALTTERQGPEAALAVPVVGVRALHHPQRAVVEGVVEVLSELNVVAVLEGLRKKTESV